MKKPAIAATLLAVASSLLLNGTASSSVDSFSTSENFVISELSRIISGSGETGAEIPTYHAPTQQLFSTNAVENSVDIYSIADPSNPARVARVYMDQYGDNLTSVAAGDKVIVAAVTRDPEFSSDGTPTAKQGVLVIMTPNGKVINTTSLRGVLPDSVNFTPDGKTALIAIEAEPVCAKDNEATPDVDESEEFSAAFDGYGRITIVDLAKPRSPKVRVVNFADVSATNLASKKIPVNETVGNVARDLEPEYVYAPNNKVAYVSVQEANAFGKINLSTGKLVALFSAGFVDRGEVGFDPSDRDASLGTRTYSNVFGTRQPDTISAFTIGSDRYLVSANEGDSREYDCLDDDDRAEDLEVDPNIFPNWNVLNDDSELGRMKVDPNLGDFNNDGLHEAIYARGGRSITIYKNGEPIWDSGNLFETIPASVYGEQNINGQFDFDSDTGIVSYEPQNRSDDKGVEPEGLAIGQIGNRRIAMVGLERISALVLFDITNPVAPEFEEWLQMQPLTDTDIADSTAWSPEGLIFIPADKSPNGKALVVSSYEVSGSMVIHEITLR